MQRFIRHLSLEKPRINHLGIQYLSESIHKKVFPTVPIDHYLKTDDGLLSIAKNHLKHHNLLGKKTQLSSPINIQNLPSLLGNSLDEHFYKIGKHSSDSYLKLCEEFFNGELPPKPSKWCFKPGWYRYEFNKDPEPVKYPLESQLAFDVEVMYKQSQYAVLATCVSPKAWYGWVSPLLTNYAQDSTYNDYEHLIPMNCLEEEKLIVGFNVSYDRARILEEYNLKQLKAFYLDAMSLHISTAGLCSHQRPQWLKHQKSLKVSNDEEAVVDEYSITETLGNKEVLAQELIDDPWLNKGAPNSLANVAKFHCGIDLDKDVRNSFQSLDPQDIIDDFNNLMDYCSGDVAATFEVTKKLFPIFKQKIPHPVSFAALRHLGTLVLPTTKKWDQYVDSAERVYEDNRDEVTNILKDRANELVEYISQGDPSKIPDFNDPWLKQLNWDLKLPRLKKNGDPVANQAYLTGYPEWYRELFKTTEDDYGEKIKELTISVRTRVTPLLLRLKWEGYPLFWTESNGWCFKVPFADKKDKEFFDKGYIKAKLSDEDVELYYEDLTGEGNELWKVPHPDGANKRCTAVMSKTYSQYFTTGVLTSEYSYASEILDLNSTASYWMGNRTRILEQFVIYSDPKKNQIAPVEIENKKLGIVIPKLVTMGTITRRATENTWLTASNAKKNRIGSELKSLIQAPPGYKFVGADVDSEELWIAALIGDSLFKVHGSTALSWMTLEGDKNQGTDLHSKTAEILGISRGEAKIFNYGRIYGAGVKFATTLLKKCNSSLTDEQAVAMARKLYNETKGQYGASKLLKRKIYHGGTESVMFNALENIAHSDDPRTPVLGAAITDALTAKNLNKNNYITSRTNWAIQSSGVDYLHLLIVSMEYLIKKYKVDARLMITVHDELRYLVKDEDKYKIALLLQISNLWTRAMFVERLGFTELPQSVAFFSEVDIDHVLRKEVSLDCVTPSQTEAIPPGESLDIYKLLEKTNNGEILSELESDEGENFNYEPTPLVIETLTKHLDEKLKIAQVRLETSADKDEWNSNLYEYGKIMKSSPSPRPPSTPKKPKKVVEYDLMADGDEELENMINSPPPYLKKENGHEEMNLDTKQDRLSQFKDKEIVRSKPLFENLKSRRQSYQ